jgi:hypothetical protein
MPTAAAVYGGTVQFVRGMSLICAKAMLGAPSVIAEIQRRTLLEYRIISALLFFRVVPRSAGVANATWHQGAGKPLRVFPSGISKIA